MTAKRHQQGDGAADAEQQGEDRRVPTRPSAMQASSSTMTGS